MLIAGGVRSQITVRGTVYDSSRLFPLEAVSVLTTSGRGTYTDADGMYQIVVNEKDSIWFSYLNKPTMKFAVARIQNVYQFDISLQIHIPVMKEIRLKPRDYRLDSIQNRRDYERIFNYEKPNIATMTNIGPTGAGIDLEQLIALFQFRKNKRTLAFQDRLINEEKEKYVDHRFNKQIVRRLTNLDGDSLDLFMTFYRPPYDRVVNSSDYELQRYIQVSHQRFVKGELRREPRGF